MAYQIVATSVPRGLDGVSGYQTVLKSQGIPPRVFDRLKARAGYSHPYSHGDPRNPVVYLHRIEELAGSRWHVLGCIRDAGSDHTGRSNFLAHMLGVEAGEARSKPGGPAAAAMAGGCFLTKWDGPPDGTALPKTLVAGDLPPAAGDLPAWKTAGLDLGIAGDLAAAAMRNEKVVLVTRPSDDVLALFADAMRLVEPSKRWGVTFNTCAMEDFDGTWKAVRNDLVDAKNVRTGKAAVIDLTAGERGSEDPYAQFARGDKSSLPWQKFSRAVAAPPADSSPPESPVAASNLPSPVDDRHVLPGAPPASPSPTRERARRPRYIEKDEPSHVPWQLITVASLLLLIGGGAWFAFRDQLLGLAQPAGPRSPTVDREIGDAVDLPSAVRPPTRGDGTVPTLPEQVAGTDSLKEASDRLAEKRAEIVQQLENGAYSSARTQVNDLLRQVVELRAMYGAEWETLVTSDGIHQDPSPAIDQIRQAFDNLNDIISDVDKVLDSRIVAMLPELEEKRATLTAMEDALGRAVAGVDGLQTQINNLEAALHAMQTETRQEEAFKEFQTLAKAVSLPAAGWQQNTDIGGRVSAASESKEIDLGPFPFADLVDPQVRLAVPRDLDDGDSIELVHVASEQPASWEILYLSGAVGLNNEAQPPRRLASLFANDSRLLLKPENLEQGLGSLLRRSVIVLEVKPPNASDSELVRQGIRLVEPTRAPPLAVDLFENGKQVLSLSPPPGVSRHIRNSDGGTPQLRLPVKSMRFEAIMSGRGATRLAEWRHDFTEDDVANETGGNWKTNATLVDVRPNFDLVIEADVEVSLRSAVLGLRTKCYGRYAEMFGSTDGERKDNIKQYFIDNPSKVYAGIKAKFDRAVDHVLKSTNPGVIERWFDSRVAVPSNSGMDMAEHATIRMSFSKILEEQYQEAVAEEKNVAGMPRSFKAFRERAGKSFENGTWDDHFKTPVKRWAEWFWAKYEAEWRRAEEVFQGALAEEYEIHVTRVVSLAYDEDGEEYEVPLVVVGESEAAEDGPDPREGGGAVGLE